MHFCSFYTEGPPNDECNNFTEIADKIKENAEGHFDSITFYTPKKLRDLGYSRYLKEYPKTILTYKWSPFEKIGLSSFRPAMFLHSLSQMKDGEILFHRDINWKKYPHYSNFDNIEETIKGILTECQFDFFVGSHGPICDRPPLIKERCKTNVLRELGENHPFSYEFTQVHACFFIMRKSSTTIELLKDWQSAMENHEWLDGYIYGPLHPEFQEHCFDQSLLSVVIANWVRKRKENIPLQYPQFGFRFGDFNQKFYVKNFEYLKYLTN